MIETSQISYRVVKFRSSLDFASVFEEASKYLAKHKREVLMQTDADQSAQGYTLSLYFLAHVE